MNKVSGEDIDPDRNNRTTAEEEIALAPLARSGDEEAINRLCEGNLGLLYYLSGSYARAYGIPVRELVSEGYMGLRNAAKKYDPVKGEGARFGTFAGECIRQAYSKSLSGIWKGASVVKVPPKISKRTREIISLRNRLIAEGKDYGVEELARITGYSTRVVRSAELDLTSQLLLSMPVAGRDGGDSNLEGMLAHPGAERAVEESDTRQDYASVREHIDKLPEKERIAVVMRLGLEGNRTHNYQEIGRRLGMGKANVGSVLARAYSKLREAIKPNDIALREAGDGAGEEMMSASEQEQEPGKVDFSDEQRNIYVTWMRGGGLGGINRLSELIGVPKEVVARILKKRNKTLV